MTSLSRVLIKTLLSMGPIYKNQKGGDEELEQVKATITINKEIKQRMAALKQKGYEFNLSYLCRRAIEDKLTEMESEIKDEKN